jgi:hypothetical protein
MSRDFREIFCGFKYVYEMGEFPPPALGLDERIPPQGWMPTRILCGFFSEEFLDGTDSAAPLFRPT